MEKIWQEEGVQAMNAGDLEKAEFLLLRSYECRSDLELCCQLGSLYRRKGQHDLSYRFFRRALLHKRNDASLMLECGISLLDAGEVHRSISWFLRCLRLQNQIQALYHLARAYAASNRPERALRYLHLVRRMDPQFPFPSQFMAELQSGDC
jgi:tetratricopeptide (TPR) repeat protein